MYAKGQVVCIIIALGKAIMNATSLAVNPNCHTEICQTLFRKVRDKERTFLNQQCSVWNGQHAHSLICCSVIVLIGNKSEYFHKMLILNEYG